MSRPSFRRAIGWCVLAAAPLLLSCGRREGAGSHPGAPIVLVSIDTLRADRLPAYGYGGVATPAIDRLAAEGIVFENAYTHVPLTLPAHASVFTGRLPPDTGVRSNIGYRLEPDRHPTLPRLLADRGYATGAAVSAYVLRADTGIGSLFDFYDDSLEVWEAATLGALQRSGRETVRAALGWVDRVRERPFFLFLHLFEPHSPYEPEPPFRRYADPYDGEIATVDAILGDFFAELEKRGLYDDALVVLFADHGEGLGDHGEQEHGVLLYREALHVPLVVKLPGGAGGGRRVAAPAALVDLLPTLVAAAGGNVPEGLPGTSLLALGEGDAAPERSIYSETLYPRLHLGWSELRSLVDGRHHYIEGPVPEIYDVVADPRETRDLRRERRREARELADRLAAIPLALSTPAAGDPEEMARLTALGYVSAPAAEGDGPRRNPRDHVAVLARVQETFELNRQGRYVESVELCREILREYPDLVDVYNQLAGNLRRLGRFAEARDAYHEAIRRSPSLVDSLALEVAKVELDLGNLEAAELNARQALELNPAEAHLVLGGIAMARSDWRQAEGEARAALGDPDQPRLPALILLSRALVEQGRLEEALAAADRAAARVAAGAPPVATLAATRGDVLARLGRTAEAEAALREEVSRFPATTEAYVHLAILYASQRRFDEIEPTLEAMVAAAPVPATYALAARAMADLGNEEGARDFRRRGERLLAERQRLSSR